MLSTLILRTIDCCGADIRAARHIERDLSGRNMHATLAAAAPGLRERQRGGASRRRIVRSWPRVQAR
ncbi:hypothetical protein [Paraburkholderia sp. RL18-085-BIA-A]|jgi:hypothetical protein|uniref:hypothetical protein n=1 Tax=Paraburkholderia sp. RL18-085-BIA-A TaxID=3031633 RepID=UPI0038BD6DB6